jgi:hypothetical protein
MAEAEGLLQGFPERGPAGAAAHRDHVRGVSLTPFPGVGVMAGKARNDLASLACS